jgi:signal transduction histidine kinase
MEKTQVAKNNNVPLHLDQINAALSRLEKVILHTLNFDEVIQNVVNSLFSELGDLKLGYKIIVLGLVDQNKGLLKRVSISQTEEAKKGVSRLPIPFDQVEIPLDAKENYSIKVIDSGEPQVTHQWSDILCPSLTFEEANKLQNEVGIKTSLIYPLKVRGKAIGMMIFSMIKNEDQISNFEKELLQRFTDICALAVQNSQLYTSLQETSEKLKKANIQLKEADELKDEFVYIASHELRTPMTAIKNYLWLALNKYQKGMDEGLKKDINRAYISTERLIKLVQDMLTVSRIEGKRLVLNFEEIDLIELYKQIIDEIKVTADKESISLTLVPPQQPVKIEADRTRILEVLQNLLSNAIKFTPRGGSVTISIEKTADNIITRVSDTGYGIPEEDMPRLFKKFGRLGHSYKKVAESAGTGLGLFISKQIVEAHKGTISVTSEVDKGSTFTYTLPIRPTIEIQNENAKAIE